MKKIIFITFLTIYSFVTAQNINGTILYGKINATLDLKNFPAEMKALAEKANIDSNKIDYTLNFIDNESYFFANQILLEDQSKFVPYVTIGGGKLKYYQNTTTKEYREFKESTRTGKTIVDSKENYEWTLENEFKIIDGYKCYKAISPYINQDGIKNSDPKFNIIAWYTPQIPVSLGPIGYGDLPGLIMELQKPDVTFFVKKINLNLNQIPFIDKLTFIKAISRKQLLEMAKKTMTVEQLEAVEASEKKQ